MKLADKRCYPTYKTEMFPSGTSNHILIGNGLTFKERLVIALASNPNMIAINKESGREYLMSPVNAVRLIHQVDAIIAELEKEK